MFEKQIEYLKLVQDRIPEHLNAVETLSTVLGIGNDSTYRRLRGETALTYEEAFKLADNFGLSLDSVGIDVLKRVDFDAGAPIEGIKDYEAYSKRIMDRMLRFENESQKAHMFYFALDFPLFYIYQYPALARLKSYYWGKSILGLPEMSSISFEEFKLSKDRQEKDLEVMRSYARIPSTEIWTNSSFVATLKQLQYCWQTGVISRKEDALTILNELEDLLGVMRLQSDTGKKLNPLSGEPTGAEFNWYISELSVGNNAVHIRTHTDSHTFLSFNTFNFIETSNSAFNKQTKNWLDNFLKRSLLVGPCAIGQRDEYIKKLTGQIDSIRRVILSEEETLL
ncbi:MAG: Uncharacterised protein [Owenweeksia sp. TMED14]|nr:MAG: Uncharacterised protein [Owenweeksia sp. TMED14]|tara:strand:- start:6165 stop:7178 length:1014 start_codon:yes stop_codon:yes gene_type:complete